MLSRKTPLFLTFEYPPDKGGVGMYVAMFKEAIPEAMVERLVPGRRFFSYAIQVARKARRASIVVSQGVFPLGTVALLFRLLLRIEFALVYHGNDFDQARRSYWRRALMRFITKRAKVVVANSQALREELEAYFGRPVIAILPCLSSELLAIQPKHTEGSTVRLLSIARLVPRKGILEVLKAIRSVEGVLYTICGEGPELERLMRYVADQGLEKRVRFVRAGTAVEKARLYNDSDIFVLPTRLSTTDREGFGIVYLEAGYFGLPSIATRTKGVDEAVIDEETGILVDESTQAIVEAIRRLAGDELLRRRLGEMAHARVLQAFLPEHRIELIRSLFYV